MSARNDGPGGCVPWEDHVRLRSALAEIVGDYGCVMRTPADPSLPPLERPACREEHADDRSYWCAECIASAAVEASKPELNPDARVLVTCFDPSTGESETQELPIDSYVLVRGERCEISSMQVYGNGTHQITLKPVRP